MPLWIFYFFLQHLRYLTIYLFFHFTCLMPIFCPWGTHICFFHYSGPSQWLPYSELPINLSILCIRNLKVTIQFIFKRIYDLDFTFLFYLLQYECSYHHNFEIQVFKCCKQLKLFIYLKTSNTSFLNFLSL